MKTPEQILTLTVEVEKAFDVNSLRYRGIRVWPLIRNYLWFRLSREEADAPAGIKASYTNKAATAPLEAVERDTNQVGLLERFRARSLHQKKRNRVLGSFKQLSRFSGVDILFKSNPLYCSELLENGFMDRVHDPIIRLIKGHATYLKLEIASRLGSKRTPRSEPTLFVGPMPLSALNRDLVEGSRWNYFGRRRINKFPKLERVISEISGIEGLVNQKSIIETTDLLLEFSEYYEALLGVLKPKLVFLSAHSTSDVMGLLLACRKEGIPTVEIQHGDLGRHCTKYCGWTKIPNSGYEVLPDFYWLWGEETKRSVKSLRPAGCDQHLPLVGGYPFLSMFLEKNGFQLPLKDQEYLDSLHGYKRIVLYCNEGVGGIPQVFLEAIKRSPSGWKWLIRLHPVQRDKAVPLARSLGELGIPDVDIEAPTRISLYALLSSVDHVACRRSSVGYEALALETPVTIVHPDGLALFQDDIDAGALAYAESSDEFLSEIVRNSRGTNKPQSLAQNRIETSAAVTRECIKVIFEKAGLPYAFDDGP